MKFTEAVQYYLNTKNSNINEMALKHLVGTDEMWKDRDLEGVADKYIENALADGKNYTNILRGLTVTFKSKRFADDQESTEELKEIIKKKVRAAQKEEKNANPTAPEPKKPRAKLIKKADL